MFCTVSKWSCLLCTTLWQSSRVKLSWGCLMCACVLPREMQPLWWMYSSHWQLNTVLGLCFSVSLFKMYLFEKDRKRERETEHEHQWGGTEAGGERMQKETRLPPDCAAQHQLDGQDPRSWPEPKPKAGRLTSWATQAPHVDLFIRYHDWLGSWAWGYNWVKLQKTIIICHNPCGCCEGQCNQMGGMLVDRPTLAFIKL